MKLERGQNYTSKREMPGSEDGWEEKDGKDVSFSICLLVKAEMSITNQNKI